MAPVANVLMRLGCQGKGTKNFSRQRDFFKLGNYHCEKAYIQMLYFCQLTSEKNHITCKQLISLKIFASPVSKKGIPMKI